MTGMLADALIAVLALAAVADGAGTPAVSRIVVRNGRFVDKSTGKQFVPLGVNYFRAAVNVGHATFCPGSYDRAFVEKMMADLAASGFNTIRTFHAYHVGENGILASPASREISPRYLANMVHFLAQARRHGLRVIFTWDVWLPSSEWLSSTPLPNETKYPFLPALAGDMGLNGYRLHLRAVRTHANAIVEIIRALRKQDPGLLPVVLAWELENEVYFTTAHAPFNTREGSFSFGGKTYEMRSDDQVQSLLDEATVQWVNACAEAIHRADPEALVSAPVYTFAAVGRGGPGTLSEDVTGDPRIPARPMALLRTGVDYVDIHLYAWKTEKQSVSDFLELGLGSVEWDKLKAEAARLGKPVMAGEVGVAAHYLRKPPDNAIDHTLGVGCLREHLKGVRDRGFAGALYWPYGSPDSTANDENPALTLFPEYGRALRAVWSSK